MSVAAPNSRQTDGSAALLRSLFRDLGALGITRLADQTGLDRIGISSFAAIRPNSATVTTHQGKGLDDSAARISAIMEAAEYRFAEAPAMPVLRNSASALRSAGIETMSVAHLLPRDAAPRDDLPVNWLEGRDLASGAPVFVPTECIAIGTPPKDLPGISQSTNGLAAGSNRDGALLHGLCEVIERDAVCLWGFRNDAGAARTRFAPARLGDTVVDRLVQQVESAGFTLALFDQTSNLGVPVVYAVLAPANGADRHFEVATGAGCHPVPAIAAQRAILEAAQTRISIIAGARDDIEGGGYLSPVHRDIAMLTRLPIGDRAPPVGLSRGVDDTACLAFVRAGLDRAHLVRTIVVPLGGSDLGIDVLRVFVSGLEDRLTNRHWRPGPRAARAMLGLA